MRCDLALMAYNRPAYFAPVLRAWAGVRGLERWNPVVYVEPSREQAEVFAIAAAHEIGASLNPVRYGVLEHPWRILEHLLGHEESDFVIIAEDDVLVADDILDYFGWAAERFAGERVLAVCASSFAGACPPGQEHRVVLGDRFTPMVWGTWRDRWEQVLRESWDHDYSSGTPGAPQSGWDWNLNLRVIPAGGWLCAQPVSSRTDHIGRTGIHTTAVSFPGSVSATFTPHYPPGRFHTVAESVPANQ